MSSAYVSRSTPSGGVGRSDIYILKRVGESVPPCGTPALICCGLDCLF